MPGELGDDPGWGRHGEDVQRMWQRYVVSSGSITLLRKKKLHAFSELAAWELLFGHRM